MIGPELISSVEAMHAYGTRLAAELQLPTVCYLQGQLGAGKTTLTQGIAKGLGYNDAVTSPTYNLVHEYSTSEAQIFHLDLYRLEDPQELEMLGLLDIISDYANYLVLIEWPEKGEGYLPKPDIEINIEPTEQGRKITVTRL